MPSSLKSAQLSEAKAIFETVGSAAEMQLPQIQKNTIDSRSNVQHIQIRKHKNSEIWMNALQALSFFACPIRRAHIEGRYKLAITKKGPRVYPTSLLIKVAPLSMQAVAGMSTLISRKENHPITTCRVCEMHRIVQKRAVAHFGRLPSGQLATLSRDFPN